MILSVLQSYDLALLDLARSWIDPYSQVTLSIIHIGADLLLFLFPLYLLLLWLVSLGDPSREGVQRYALRIVFSVVLSILLCLLSNALLPMRPRPETLSTIAPLIAHIPDNSFPSMHATFTGAGIIALFLFLTGGVTLRRDLGLLSLSSRLFLLIVGLVMVSCRVLAGIHYPGDIIAGLLLGAFSAWIISRLVSYTWWKMIEDFWISVARKLKLG